MCEHMVAIAAMCSHMVRHGSGWFAMGFTLHGLAERPGLCQDLRRDRSAVLSLLTLFDRLSRRRLPARHTDSASAMTSLTGRTVVVLHAHPDDESIFTGATIRRLVDAGARVVLVTATCGELGGSRISLAPDETLAERRLVELEWAAERLGVARLVLLGRRDSGLPGTADNVHPGALAAADADRLARRVAQLAIAESAEALVYDDPRGIYGHPDHVAVHQMGSRAAAMVGITGYETTVDRDQLRTAGPHLVDAAARATASGYGLPTEQISVTIEASGDELAAKRSAIAAHVSQVDSRITTADGFDAAYRFEWFRRSGPAALLDVAAARPAALAAALP
jgi:LmbE family N-acetylglucosaminyl deacetylase